MSRDSREEADEKLPLAYRLQIVTPEAVEKVLEGFSLELQPDRDWVWLAEAIRRALAITVRERRDGPKRTSNAEIRQELERLADLASSTWIELFRRDESVDYRLWTIAWRHWDGEGGNVSEPAAYRRYNSALAELDWLSGFLKQTARETQSQKGPWRQSMEKRVRRERGQYLAPIFEAAFGQAVSANNYPNDARHKAPTAFMDFYERIVSLAFGAGETVNLAEVVKAACHLHRRSPVQFGEGVVPGL